MTTNILAEEGPRPGPSAGRLGAVAGLTPIAMFGAWIAISGWGGTPAELARAMGEVSLGAVVAGWIVGGRLGHTIHARAMGMVAYGFVAWLVLFPFNVAGSTWEDLRVGRVSDLFGVVVSASGYVVYGAISGLYAVVFLLPFGVGWIVTFLLLERAFSR